jgi:hypothetical protein
VGRRGVEGRGEEVKAANLGEVMWMLVRLFPPHVKIIDA